MKERKIMVPVRFMGMMTRMMLFEARKSSEARLPAAPARRNAFERNFLAAVWPFFLAPRSQR
jgi:hypothetical protein